MSHTRGTTARGLPYPGSTEPVYNLPTFLQQLADAVQAQLDSAGAGRLLVPAVVTMTTNSNGFILVPMPGLAVVRGALLGAGPGGNGPYLYYLSPTSWTDQNSRGKAVIGVASPTVDGGGGYPASVKNTSVGVTVLAWGDPG